MKKVYRVYQIDNKGMLEEPLEYNSKQYKDKPSEAEAIEELKANQAYGEYVILPITKLGYWDYCQQ